MSTGFLAVTAEEVSITTRLLMAARMPIKTEGHNLLFHFQMEWGSPFSASPAQDVRPLMYPHSRT
jgi:hypothetical protein